MDEYLELWPICLEEARRFLWDLKYCYTPDGCGFATWKTTRSISATDICPNCGRATYWLANFVLSPDDKAKVQVL